MDTWPYFPGIKVGKLFIFILLVLLFAGVFFSIVTYYVVRLFLPQARRLTETVFTCRFCLLSQDSGFILKYSLVERLQIRPVGRSVVKSVKKYSFISDSHVIDILANTEVVLSV